MKKVFIFTLFVVFISYTNFLHAQSYEASCNYLKENWKKYNGQIPMTSGKLPPKDPKVIDIVRNACNLALGKDCTYISGYRSPSYNKRVGGAKKSQHILGKAIDFTIPTGDRKKRERVITYIICGLGIANKCQGGLGIYRSGSVHVDTRTARRNIWSTGYTRANIPGNVKNPNEKALLYSFEKGSCKNFSGVIDDYTEKDLYGDPAPLDQPINPQDIADKYYQSPPSLTPNIPQDATQPSIPNTDQTNPFLPYLQQINATSTTSTSTYDIWFAEQFTTSTSIENIDSINNDDALMQDNNSGSDYTTENKNTIPASDKWKIFTAYLYGDIPKTEQNKERINALILYNDKKAYEELKIQLQAVRPYIRFKSDETNNNITEQQAQKINHIEFGVRQHDIEPEVGAIYSISQPENIQTNVPSSSWNFGFFGFVKSLFGL